MLVGGGVGFEVGAGDWLFWLQPGDFRPALWPTFLQERTLLYTGSPSLGTSLFHMWAD